ncbi:hypothetical protein Scep_007239 [Stephania cephalantha]|uniref:Uncharacterized protein n=1 Tax=Stephania cephalantha TaxID=152367 RepID=A0AAP0K9P3_9MAGN
MDSSYPTIIVNSKTHMGYASPQPDFFGLMSSPRIPQHEESQQFQESTSLEDMVKQLIEDQQRLTEEFRQFKVEIPSLKNLESQLIQFNAMPQIMIDEEELCSTRSFFYPEEDVSVDTLKNLEVNELTQIKDYLSETTEGSEVFHIESEIVIAPNEEEDNEMKIDVISDRPKKL